MSTEKSLLEAQSQPSCLGAVISRFVSVKLNREIVEGMISTYEFFVWNSTGDEKKGCKKILNALKKSLL
jgi:hypothetical protein